ncbi:dermonecrotic toxin domain-containing protein [Pseudomonas sp. 2835]|uniref:dermonecrotic toxin domain-containing protein n=1 Tax=Pseudomonas sp. 2835 TaxID=3156451 RepID=UPI003D1B613F
MTSTKLPYFHPDALRAGFRLLLEQLDARQPLSDAQRQSLQRLGHDPALRVDRLDTLTDDGQAIALDTTFLLSRADWPEVFIYNPDIGLQRFANRRQVKQALLSLQDHPTLIGKILRYAPAAHRQHLQRHPAVDFQVNLVNTPLFDSLMLTINDRLAEQATPRYAQQAPPSTATLQRIASFLGDGNPDAASTEAQLELLVAEYHRVLIQRPSLNSITRALMKRELSSFLENGPPLHAITVQPEHRSAPVLSLIELVWHPADNTLWHSSAATAAELPTTLPLLPPALISHCAQRVRQSLRQQLQAVLMQDDQQLRDYQQHLLTLIAKLAERLDVAFAPTSLPSRQTQVLALYDRAIAARLPGNTVKAFNRHISDADAIGTTLRNLQDRARAQAIAAHAPEWLRKASTNDQHAYLRVLAKNLLGATEDYLFDIPAIDTYAREHLQQRLDQDFGPGHYRPEAIQVTTNRWITAPPLPGEIPLSLPASYVRHRQSLVDYALDHYRDWDNAIILVTDQKGELLPPTLRSQYVRMVAKALDIGGHYQRLLQQKFAEHDPDYARRLATFCRQLPGQMLEAAWRARLKGELDGAALQTVTQVLELPEDRTQHMTPLLLVADSGLEPDPVPGLYLIGNQQAGPLVLYSPYDSRQAYRQFADSRDLLKKIRTTPAFQALLLGRMPAQMRKRYARGGFEEPHLPFSVESDFDLPFSRPGPITLAWRPLAGNLFKQLFLDNAQLLQDMAHAQLITLEEARWQTLKNLLGQLGLQVGMFLPGRLGTLLGIFQTETSVLQTLDKLDRNTWSQSLAELCAALVQGLLVGQGEGKVRSVEAFWKNLDTATTGQRPGLAESGGVLSDLSGRFTRRVVSREQIAILAVGMAQIQRVNPYRGNLIREAHDTAVSYLVNCHYNISRTTAGQLPQQTAKVLRDFFNVADVSDALLMHVSKPIEKLLRMLLSRNYSPAYSMRYVMGSRVGAPIDASAFVNPADRSRQIFLLDAFFDNPTINQLPLQGRYAQPQAANLTRAFTLLHELSHLACQTRDITYTLGVAPYADWLISSPERDWLERAHDSGFSAMTPINKLFKVFDEDTGRLRDLRRSDRKGKKLILKITGAQDLQQARQVFLNDSEKRAQIMLFNADSLALLIYRLGAEPHP